MRLNFFAIAAIAILKVSVIYPQTDFEKWLKKENEKFEKYLSEEDKKFVSFLENEWKKYKLVAGIEKDKTPKPIEAPIYNPDDFNEEIEDEFDLKHLQEIEKEFDDIRKRPKRIEIESPKPIINNSINISQLPIKKNIFYYGNEKQFGFPLELDFELDSKLNNESVAEYWKFMSSINYIGILEQAIYHKNSMQLNDWGYIQLLKKIAEGVYQNQRNHKHLFVWFMLLKSGYRVKAGIIDNNIFIFFPSMHKIYEIAFFKATENDPRLYILDLDNIYNRASGYLYTYENDYPDADKLLDMRIRSFPRVSEEYIEKKLKWGAEAKKYEINVKYNKGFIDYLKDYPYSDLSIYFNSTASPKFRSSILTQLKDIIKDKPEKETIDILLEFVQNSFQYKTDLPHFGREKPLFPEETVYYPYSDCEDRAAIFAYLVKNLTGLKIVGVDYPGHVATAVKFNNYQLGSRITHNKEVYTICDPTFVGATAGLEMPEFHNEKNKRVIEIE